MNKSIALYQSMGCVDATEIVEIFVDSDDDRYLEYCINSI